MRVNFMVPSRIRFLIVVRPMPSSFAASVFVTFVILSPCRNISQPRRGKEGQGWMALSHFSSRLSPCNSEVNAGELRLHQGCSVHIRDASVRRSSPVKRHASTVPSYAAADLDKRRADSADTECILHSRSEQCWGCDSPSLRRTRGNRDENVKCISRLLQIVVRPSSRPRL